MPSTTKPRKRRGPKTAPKVSTRCSSVFPTDQEREGIRRIQHMYLSIHGRPLAESAVWRMGLEILMDAYGTGVLSECLRDMRRQLKGDNKALMIPLDNPEAPAQLVDLPPKLELCANGPAT